MVMTYSDRIALLEKARAAKAAKRAGLNKKSEPEPEPEPAPAPAPKPVKTRVKKQPPSGRTLELPPEPAPISDDEPEIEERIVYRPKPEKKKKKIIRTIIKDHSSDDEEEEEEIHETVEQPPKSKTKKQISNKQPKLCPSKSSYFCY